VYIYHYASFLPGGGLLCQSRRRRPALSQGFSAGSCFLISRWFFCSLNQPNANGLRGYKEEESSHWDLGPTEGARQAGQAGRSTLIETCIKIWAESLQQHHHLLSYRHRARFIQFISLFLCFLAAVCLLFFFLSFFVSFFPSSNVPFYSTPFVCCYGCFFSRL
jgi:hypothetical protein